MGSLEPKTRTTRNSTKKDCAITLLLLGLGCLIGMAMSRACLDVAVGTRGL